MKPPKYGKNIQATALLLNISTHTLQSWGQVSGCPCRPGDKIHGRGYNLHRIRKWAAKNGFDVDARTGRIE